MQTPFKLTQLCGISMCAMLALSSCAEFQSGFQNSSNSAQGRSRGITPGMEGGFGALLAGAGAIINNNGGGDLGKVMMGVGGLLVMHAAYRYSADAHQKQLAQSRAGGRSGSYYVRVPPKSGYTGPKGTHLVPYKDGAIAGSVKVVPEKPGAGRTITVDGTQGTVL